MTHGYGEKINAGPIHTGPLWILYTSHHSCGPQALLLQCLSHPAPLSLAVPPGSGMFLMLSGSSYHRGNACTLHSPLPSLTLYSCFGARGSSSEKHIPNPAKRSDAPAKCFRGGRCPSAAQLPRPSMVNSAPISASFPGLNFPGAPYPAPGTVTYTQSVNKKYLLDECKNDA